MSISSGVVPYPVMSWRGSRASLSESIRARFPKNFGIYHEPMVGGCGVFLGVQHYPAVIAENKRWLMDTYWAIKEDYRRVGEILDSLTPSREVYDRVKNIYPLDVDLPFRAAHLIFLNQLAFMDTFRVNRDGKFNMPFGKPKRFIYTMENLQALSESLNGVRLEYGDFEETTKSTLTNDFVYFDPPCPDRRINGLSRSVNSASFEFTPEDYRRFTETCFDLDKRGVKWAVTDNNTSLIRLCLNKFNVIDLVRSKEDNEVEVVLITNYSA